MVSSVIFLSKTESLKPIKATSTKELLFEDFSLVELNDTGIAHQIISSKAIKDKNFFTLSDINITYNQTQHLCAKEARYEEHSIYLKDDVILKRDDGIYFNSEHLKYSIQSKTLQIDSNFSLDINGSRIVGENLHYRLDKRSIFADNIRAKILFEK